MGGRILEELEMKSPQRSARHFSRPVANIVLLRITIMRDHPHVQMELVS